MPTLRITSVAEGESIFNVTLNFEADRSESASAQSHFTFTLSEYDQERFRWYYEEYLLYPFDPAPIIASTIEQQLSSIGDELFACLFHSSDESRELWHRLRKSLSDTRVEVIVKGGEPVVIPWELLRNPEDGTLFALHSRSFVRHSVSDTGKVRIIESDVSRIRLLLVISRPGGADDVPFRSVANYLIKSLTQRDDFDLDVLRPPTFIRLIERLQEAQDRGEPYHVVHFDGHGVFDDLEAKLAGNPPTNKRGYLLFENPDDPGNVEWVDGEFLGEELSRAGVLLLILNACRSAHAEPRPEPVKGTPDDRALAFGSLAQEVAGAGVQGVVAMRYNVYVVTAARFVAGLYTALVSGRSLGEAVAEGRKNLRERPLREIAYAPRELQDWSVPIVYESAPLTLFPSTSSNAKATVESSGLGRMSLGTPDLPPAPEAGFWGRDDTLLELDQVFNVNKVILLHDLAGSGKTSTAVEFARWYQVTGGVSGPVLFTSFEQYKPLGRVLEAVGEAFGEELSRRGIQWDALTGEEKLEEALRELRSTPVLWIWDNVETVAGFPRGTPSAWTADEQKELAEFLREASTSTQAKFLLTSRREEREWLGGIPRRLHIPPMPMTERVQLARAIAEGRGRRLDDLRAWWPLLEFTEGNPLTITVVIGQALQRDIVTEEQVKEFVARLREGEAVVSDDKGEGRSSSLSASLGYGFANSFGEDERRQLALLYFFQGFVDVDALVWMGDNDRSYYFEPMRGFTREAGISLLDRASEIGMLRPHGGGYYSIHPALPWFFKNMFEQYYPAHSAHGDLSTQAAHAFVGATRDLGANYHELYRAGKAEAIIALTYEEYNLLHAFRLAHANGWWDPLVGIMQPLDYLYGYKERRAEWERLVDQVIPDLVDPGTDGPLPGREEEWSFITDFRALLAEKDRDWVKAERLQLLRVDWTRQRVSTFLKRPADSWDKLQTYDVQSLGIALLELGQIQSELGNAACVKTYAEAIAIAEQIGEARIIITAAVNLAKAYLTIKDIRDITEAERWANLSLKLHDPQDTHKQAKIYVIWARIARERLADVMRAGGSPELMRPHFNQSVELYEAALARMPKDAVGDLAVVHTALGDLYGYTDRKDLALKHLREAIRFHEASQDFHQAGYARLLIASTLGDLGRFPEARAYASAALRNFEAYGERAAGVVERTKKLIAEVDRSLLGR